MTTTLTRHKVADLLYQGDNYCILTHRRPDGDTLGSAAALCLALRSMGKTAHLLRNPEVTARFAWLAEDLCKEEPEGCDVLVAVDVASPGMLPEAFRQLEGHIALRIDHHAAATSFTEYELVDPDAAATGEIIFDLINELWVEMDGRISDALYVAVSTDTGCFRFSNTTDHTFVTAAACARYGARIYELNQMLFETNSLGRLKMQGWIVEHMQVFGEGKLALVSIPQAVETSIGVTEDDMDNISNFPRTVAGVCMAATLRENAKEVKLSVRAVPGWDATVIASAFGGGGHRGAAGASFSCSLEEAARQVKEAMLALENNS